METHTHPSLPPSVAEFQAVLDRSVFRSLGAAIFDLAAERGDVYTQDFEAHLNLLRKAFPERPWPKWAVDGYVNLNKAILKEEMQFRKTGEYTATPDDLEQVTADVYGNESVMDRFYLVGLFCTYFLWPHHYRILEFYRREFLDAGVAPGRFMEWGVGHGLLSHEALKRWEAATATLVDLSEFSLSFTKRLLDAAAPGRKAEYICDDVLTLPETTPAERIVCSELLEHVPDPGLLLQRLRAALAPGGMAYLTGAVNAPQPDHVFLFRSDRELLDMTEQYGFRVRCHLTACHPDRENDKTPPTVVAMVVERL